MIVTKPPHRGTEPAVDLLAGDKSVWPDDLGRDVPRNDDLGGRIGVAPAVTSGPASAFVLPGLISNRTYSPGSAIASGNSSSSAEAQPESFSNAAVADWSAL